MTAKQSGNAASSEESSAMQQMLKLMTKLDPEYLVETMQKAFPLMSIPGVDAAQLTKIQQENLAVLQGVAKMEQEVLDSTTQQELRMLQAHISETLDAFKEASAMTNPLDTSAKQTKLAIQAMDKLSQETTDLIKEVSSQQMTIIKTIAKRYVEALEEVKLAIKSPA